MKRIDVAILLIFALVMFGVGMLCSPNKAHADAFGDPPVKVSLGAIKERTQIGIGIQREWLTRSGDEYLSPRRSWVAVVPASYNLTPSVDLIGQMGYNLTSGSSRWVLGVRVVLFGGK